MSGYLLRTSQLINFSLEDSRWWGRRAGLRALARQRVVVAVLPVVRAGSEAGGLAEAAALAELAVLAAMVVVVRAVQAPPGLAPVAQIPAGRTRGPQARVARIPAGPTRGVLALAVLARVAREELPGVPVRAAGLRTQVAVRQAAVTLDGMAGPPVQAGAISRRAVAGRAAGPTVDQAPGISGAVMEPRAAGLRVTPVVAMAPGAALPPDADRRAGDLTNEA
jgi:hypothetical protein